jgi:hypothetical protein
MNPTWSWPNDEVRRLTTARNAAASGWTGANSIKIERSVPVSTVAPTPNPSPKVPPDYGGYQQGYPDQHDQHGKHGQQGYNRRKSWLGELFD